MSRGPRSSAASARTGRTRAPRTVSCSALGLNLTCPRARPRSACPGACTCARSRRRRCAGSRDGPRPARRRSRRRHSVVARGDPVDRVARSRRSNIAYRVARRAAARPRDRLIRNHARRLGDLAHQLDTAGCEGRRARGAASDRRQDLDRVVLGTLSLLPVYMPQPGQCSLRSAAHRRFPVASRCRAIALPSASAVPGPRMMVSSGPLPARAREPVAHRACPQRSTAVNAMEP